MNFNVANYEFKLTTGPKCVVRELTGNDYGTISKRRKGESLADNQNRLLADIIVSVGSVIFADFKTDKERQDFVRKMHTGDRSQVLAVARQFSFDFPVDFPFKWKGEDAQGGKIELEKIYTFEKPEGVSDEDFIPLFPTKSAKYQAEEYNLLPDTIDTVLPKANAEVKLLISTGELEASMGKRENPSLVDILSDRKPTYKDGDIWLPLPVKQLGAKDINHLFNLIKNTEGRVDSELKFDHPDAENLPEAKKTIIVNLLGVIDFFLPSEGNV